MGKDSESEFYCLSGILRRHAVVQGKLAVPGRHSGLAAAPAIPSRIALVACFGGHFLWFFPAGSTQSGEEGTSPLLGWARREKGSCVKPSSRCGPARATGIGCGHWFLFRSYLDTYQLPLVPVCWRQEARPPPQDLEWEGAAGSDLPRKSGISLEVRPGPWVPEIRTGFPSDHLTRSLG